MMTKRRNPKHNGRKIRYYHIPLKTTCNSCEEEINKIDGILTDKEEGVYVCKKCYKKYKQYVPFDDTFLSIKM